MAKGITEETANEIIKFRDDRNWKQFHNPKDLALSLCLEAAELLEVFQWSGTDLYCENKKDQIKEELADIVNYCVLMADACDIDLDCVSFEKVKRNGEKYPVEKAYGSNKKYTEF
ncbi:MAG: nucleotide pyrophosphohydrolase [Anaerolineaceae bacterium]|nr:nucleotide pyrophosphohydrolase [Anaerolineaceae bacterium]